MPQKFNYKSLFAKEVILSIITGVAGALLVFLIIKVISLYDPEVNFMLDSNLLLYMIITFYFLMAIVPLLMVKLWWPSLLQFGRAFKIGATVNFSYLATLTVVYLILGTMFNFWSVLGLLLYGMIFGLLMALTMARLLAAKP